MRQHAASCKDLIGSSRDLIQNEAARAGFFRVWTHLGDRSGPAPRYRNFVHLRLNKFFAHCVVWSRRTLLTGNFCKEKWFSELVSGNVLISLPEKLFTKFRTVSDATLVFESLFKFIDGGAPAKKKKKKKVF